MRGRGRGGWGGAGRPGAHLELAAIHQLATDGRARVTPLPGGRYQLALLLYEARQPALVAAGEVAGLAKTGPDAGREQDMLEKWSRPSATACAWPTAGQRPPPRRGAGRRRPRARPRGRPARPRPLTRRLRLHKDGR